MAYTWHCSVLAGSLMWAALKMFPWVLLYLPRVLLFLPGCRAQSAGIRWVSWFHSSWHLLVRKQHRDVSRAQLESRVKRGEIDCGPPLSILPVKSWLQPARLGYKNIAPIRERSAIHKDKAKAASSCLRKLIGNKKSGEFNSRREGEKERKVLNSLPLVSLHCKEDMP